MPALPPSSEDAQLEREALEDLIRSDGWKFFVRYVGKEWRGGGYYARMNTVLKSEKPEQAILIHKTSEEVINVLGFPERRILELTQESKA